MRTHVYVFVCGTEMNRECHTLGVFHMCEKGSLRWTWRSPIRPDWLASEPQRSAGMGNTSACLYTEPFYVCAGVELGSLSTSTLSMESSLFALRCPVFLICFQWGFSLLPPVWRHSTSSGPRTGQALGKSKGWWASPGRPACPTVAPASTRNPHREQSQLCLEAETP